MSDFTSNFWSIYVVALTLGGIFGCLLLLFQRPLPAALARPPRARASFWLISAFS